MASPPTPRARAAPSRRPPDEAHRLRPTGGVGRELVTLKRAVSGADAVISALGPSLDRKATGMPLVDGTPTGTVRAGFLGRDKIGATITRADIAGFLLDQITDTRFQRAAPAVSN